MLSQAQEEVAAATERACRTAEGAFHLRLGDTQDGPPYGEGPAAEGTDARLELDVGRSQAQRPRVHVEDPGACVVTSAQTPVGLRWVVLALGFWLVVEVLGRGGRWQVVQVPVQQFSRSWMASRIW